MKIDTHRERSRLRRRGAWTALAAGLVTLLVTLTTGTARAASPYPTPPPDFTLPLAAHGALMTPASGNKDRPMLVVYVSFTDAAPPAGKDAAFMSKLFFGSSFGSVADFYRAQSFGRFLLTPAAESQGTVNDGIVQVKVNKTQAVFDQLTNNSDYGRAREVLPLVASYVNFAAFDRNGDGKVTESELLLYVMEVRPEFCGGTRAVGSSLIVDGVDLGGRQWSGSTVTSNAITAVHELSHQAFGAFDPGPNYWPAGFDVHSGTCIPPGPGGTLDQSFWGFNAWEKVHLGWIRPTVVTRDGYYNVRRADTTGQAYVLYDPGKGTDNYLLVENRERTPGTYDKDVADSGLVIFRFDEKVYGNGTQWVDLLSPISTPAAWDPSDPATPQTKITPAWRDGSPSRVAVRAIHGHGDSISAYFDVRGPGVLADASTLPLFKVARGATRALRIPVTNTGDASDSFTVRVESLPAGWTSTVVTIKLPAQATGNVTVMLTPAVAARPGGLRLALTARSASDPSVSSTSRFWAFVRGDGTDRDADGKADPTVFRPSNGTWWFARSASGNQGQAAIDPPTAGDTPVAGDYDGDGHADAAVYRQPGRWLILSSATGRKTTVDFGGPGGVPVPADYDGDGKTDLAVFRHSTGQWLILYSSTGTSATVDFGRLGDFPVPADYDGDGKDDVAVWRSVPGEWWILGSATGRRLIPWGQSGDQPAPGDYDGDGKADLATFRPSTGDWSIRRSSTGRASTVHLGVAGDVPVPADYDGDGTTDVAVFRTTSSSLSTWSIFVSSTGTRTISWGAPGDQPAT